MRTFELETVIAEGACGEWTALGFSSIYCVLNKLEFCDLVSREFVGGAKPRGSGRRPGSRSRLGPRPADTAHGRRAA